jgi:hypothetical protein
MAEGQALWDCSLIPPAEGKIRLFDNTVNTLDQTHLPKLFFGRATRRESIRAPEDGNMAVFHNASPIGKWTLEVSPVAGQSVSLSNLRDVHIDFSVAVQFSA